MEVTMKKNKKENKMLEFMEYLEEVNPEAPIWFTENFDMEDLNNKYYKEWLKTGHVKSVEENS